LKNKNVKVYYVYLSDSTPEKRVLLSNIRKRGREFEQHYTSEKLNALEAVYRKCTDDLEGLNCEKQELELTDAFYSRGYEWIENYIADEK